jgi:ABC-type molybdate transport system substrate-binding protein
MYLARNRKRGGHLPACRTSGSGSHRAQQQTVQLIGPLPGELASTTVFSAAIGAESKSPAAAKALIEYLTSPQVLPQFKAKGFEPG